MSIKVKLSRAEQRKFEEAIKKFKRKSVGETKEILANAALRGESVAAKNAPVGTPESTGIKNYKGGTLRQSIRQKALLGGLERVIFTNVEYAVFQNNGTRFIKGKRFMEKGLKAAQLYIISKK